MELCGQCHKRWILPKDIRFLEVCEKPHLLLWAKLKGFPYWPAKLLKITDDMAQVYYFGDHERSLVPLKNCFLYSKEDPNKNINKKRMAFDRSKQVKCENAIFVNKNIIKCKIVFFFQEIEVHIEKIREKFGSFNYARYKTPLNEQLIEQQIANMIPDKRTDNSTSTPAIVSSSIPSFDSPLIPSTVSPSTSTPTVSITPKPVLFRRNSASTPIDSTQSDCRMNMAGTIIQRRKSVQFNLGMNKVIEIARRKRKHSLEFESDLTTRNKQYHDASNDIDDEMTEDFETCSSNQIELPNCFEENMDQNDIFDDKVNEFIQSEVQKQISRLIRINPRDEEKLNEINELKAQVSQLKTELKAQSMAHAEELQEVRNTAMKFNNTKTYF